MRSSKPTLKRKILDGINDLVNLIKAILLFGQVFSSVNLIKVVLVLGKVFRKVLTVLILLSHYLRIGIFWLMIMNTYSFQTPIF